MKVIFIIFSFVVSFYSLKAGRLIENEDIAQVMTILGCLIPVLSTMSLIGMFLRGNSVPEKNSEFQNDIRAQRAMELLSQNLWSVSEEKILKTGDSKADISRLAAARIIVYERNGLIGKGQWKMTPHGRQIFYKGRF